MSYIAHIIIMILMLLILHSSGRAYYIIVAVSALCNIYLVQVSQ